jgi:hypothetical protein
MHETAAEALTPKQIVDAAVDAAYLADGYINSDGNRDHQKVAQAIYQVVARARVDAPHERTAKAITKGALLEAVFPSLPKTPLEWQQQDDADLAEEVDRQVRAKVWDLAKPDRSGKVQELVGARTDGLILCRTKIGVDSVDAIYITDNIACLREDFAGPLADTMRRANRRMSLNMAMAGSRLPEHARTFDKLYKQANKRALTAGNADLALMLEVGDTDGIDGDE